MGWNLKANIRGPQGDRGAQGLPGTGAVPADEAVAGYISTGGTSATKTALGVKLDKAEALTTYDKPFRNTAILFGTSLENQGNGGPDTLDPADATAVNSRGWFTWANGYLGQRFKLIRNAGIGGNTSTQMLARIQADVIAYDPEWVFIGGPANDPSTDFTAATTIANYTAILDALAGRRIVMLNHPPRIEINTAARRKSVSQINEWIRLLPETRKNVIVVDVWRVLADPATGSPATGMAVDGTHYTTAGAQRVGAAVAAVIAPLSTPRPRRVLGALDPRNCIGNPSFTGGTGWASLGTSGATITYEAIPDTWSTKAVIELAGVADGAERGIRYLENISSARFAPGDVIQVTARFVWSNLVPLAINGFCNPFLRAMLRKVDGTYARQDILGFFVPSPVWAVPVGVPSSGDMVVATFRFTMPSGVDRLYIDLGWQGAASGRVEVSDLAVAKETVV